MIKLIVSVYGMDSLGRLYSDGVIRKVMVDSIPEVDDKGNLKVVCLESGVGYSIMDYMEV